MYNVFQEIYTTLNASGVLLDILTDRVLGEIALQPGRSYNALDVSDMTLIKVSDAHTQKDNNG
jgi:hypothetical protein